VASNFPTQQQIQAFEHDVNAVFSAIPRITLYAIVTLCALAFVLCLVTLLLRVLDLRRLLKQESVFLEITPPAFNAREPLANERLIAVLHALQETRSMTEKLLKRKAVFSPEIVSTRKQGIRYVIRVPKKYRQTFEKHYLSHAPDARLKEVKDYMPDTEALRQKSVRIVEFKQTRHFAYPLKRQNLQFVTDPNEFTTGVMTRLNNGEIMAFLMVLTPTKIRHAHNLGSKILHSDMHLNNIDHHKTPVFRNVLTGINEMLFSFTESIGEVAHGPSYHSVSMRNSKFQRKQDTAMKIHPARMMSQIEQSLANSVYTKLSGQLFRVSIRAVVITDDVQRTIDKANDIRQSLASFGEPRYQSLQAKGNFLYGFRAPYRAFQCKYRLPAFLYRKSCVLSSEEIASLYHYANSETVKTENVIKSLSKQLPAPVSLKNGQKLSVLIGENHYHQQVTPIGLTQSERERHLYIIGGTGNGKTTMLFYSILQDIRAGNGVAVIDPHGDLASRILRYIPEHRIKDVIYLNPDDLSYPIGVNLLELPEGITGDDLLREKDLVTESTVSVLRKIFSDDDSGGHRIEYVLRNSIQTALTLKNPTLFTIFDLLNDAKFRRKAIKGVEDKNLINFWKNELGKAGEFQRVKMAAGITAKIGRFLFSASAKRFLEQSKSTIDFDDILANKKILICNFSKGLLGEDTSALFGTTILAKLQTAALRRARVEDSKRNPYYLYVDEFQNFATMSFVQMLSEARKYKLLLTMAEQSTSQQDQQRLVDIILANVGTIVCFRSGSPADERLVLPLFRPFINEGEIANLPAYSFYVRIAALQAQEPMSGYTVVINDVGSGNISKWVTESSRKQYAVHFKETQRVVLKLNKLKKPVPTKLRKTQRAIKAEIDFEAAKPVQ
jgi:Type IV secretion-system coupling protein DNA-binding domain